ncbi:trehalose-6-phosphate synthase [Bradyrhizobium sp. STM 3562]|uniref:alpha,alpha-trehalose-phosphate synthase (UDP-forming) n=1 Tax=Bradyrhizobium sp. STM 3562 TaxID=578924 RepID=UPI0038900802
MDELNRIMQSAASAVAGTSQSDEQQQLLQQAAFEQHLSGAPAGTAEQVGAGPSATVQELPDTAAQQPDTKFVIISNRLPELSPDQPKTGGLAAALEPVVRRSGAVWMGSSGRLGDGDHQPALLKQLGQGQVASFDLPAAHYPGYYDYSNEILWPSLHSLSDWISGSEESFESYREVNDFLAHAAFNFRDRDAFGVQDYHLLPLATGLRQLGVDEPIGLFVHVPWPKPDVFEQIPHHRELMTSMLANNLLGFQTDEDRNNFLDCARSRPNTEIRDGVVISEQGQTLCKTFPIGIDPRQFADFAADSLEAQKDYISSLQEKLNGATLAIGVDRLDYTKGIDKRIEAFGRVLEEKPRSVALLQIATPSRSSIPAYQEYMRHVGSLVNQINDSYGTDDWKPIFYENNPFSQAQLAGLYRAAKVGVVTPLRDGMNLVAKEYVAAQDPNDPGVLVLSKFAGAAKEFGEHALLVDPNRPEEIATAISTAADMPREERIRRWRPMMDKLEAYTIHDWAADFLRTLDNTRLRVPANHFPHVGLGWMNTAKMPLFANYAEAAAAYADMDDADPEANEAAYGKLKAGFDALARSLEHKQDRLWVRPPATEPENGASAPYH